MPSPTLYRADLLRVLTAGEGIIPPRVAARLCGFDYEEPVPEETSPPPHLVAPADLPAAPQPAPEQATALAEKPRLRFWRVESLEVEPEESHRRRHEPPPEIAQAQPLTDADFCFPGSPPPGRPLLPWFRLWPFVRMALSRRETTRRPDVPRVVRRLAEGRPLRRLPCVLRSGWHPRAHVLLDRREGLAPFWDDYEFLVRRLKAVRGTLGLRVEVVPAPDLHAPVPDECCPVGLEPPPESWRALVRAAESSAVLVLGDLNQFQGTLLQSPWLGLGRQFRRRGVQPWVLCPCPRDRWSPALAHVWRLAAWDRGLRLPTAGWGQRAEPPTLTDLPEVRRQRRAQADELAVCLAPAIRVERGLLRDVRLLLPHTEADAGTEYDLWDAVPGSTLGFTFLAQQLRELRARFATLPGETQAAVLRVIRRHHEYSAKVFGHLETLALHDVLPIAGWSRLLRDGVVPPDALVNAREFLRRYVAALQRNTTELAAGTAAFAGRDLERLQGEILRLPETQALWALAHTGPDRTLPDWVRPEQIAWLDATAGGETLREVRLAAASLNSSTGMFLGQLQSRRPTVTATLHGPAGPTVRQLDWENLHHLDASVLQAVHRVSLASDRETLHLSPTVRPAWAARMWHDRNGLAAEVDLGQSRHELRWGIVFTPVLSPEIRRSMSPVIRAAWHPKTQPLWASRLWVDEFGLAAGFAVGGIPFVLRWIPPGRFLMGSPDDEPGRWDDEGPQHEVTHSRGFWLGEIPVTQAQWRAVVETAKPDRSLWTRLLPGKRTGLNPSPSHFSGPGELPVEQVDWFDIAAFCGLLDGLLPGGPGFGLPTEAQWEYACRAGTNAAFYDGSPCTMPEGRDSALDRLGWYGQNSGGKTHPVKQKPANAWGVYDTLGNVWEWCADAWGDYTELPQTDPFRDGPKDASRVAHGGSWFDLARICRAASRVRGLPGLRYRDRGFRLAAGHEPGAAEPHENAEQPPADDVYKGIEGFSPHAQQVLALARKEADRFSHNFVGTEHLLLGLIKLGQGVAVNVLQRMGLDLEMVRQEVEKEVRGGAEGKVSGNIPYTPRVKKVLSLAAKEAKVLNRTYVGTEHILLGVLREGDGVAAKVLKNLDVDIEQCRQEILKELDPGFQQDSEG
jgi:formylglycine-generating enzyme required for sulfatase activity